MAVPTTKLQGNLNIPVVGFGTAGSKDKLEEVLDYALEQGYRHLDTAYGYRNEDIIGKILQKWLSSGKIKREDLFIVTKLPSSGNTPEKVEEYLKESLKNLQLDYVDLYLIHHPIYMVPKDPAKRFGPQEVKPTDHVAIWRKMEEQVDAGRTKAIGVSNFNIRQVDRLLKEGRIKPAAIEVELHAYLQQPELVKFCQDNDVVVIAYSPIGAPGRTQYKEDSGLAPSLIQDPTVTKIAEKHKKTPAQILLKYHLSRNIVVIPRSFTPARIKENINIFDFELDEDDLKALRGLDKGEKARLELENRSGKDVESHPEYPFEKQDYYYAKEMQLPHK